MRQFYLVGVSLSVVVVTRVGRGPALYIVYTKYMLATGGGRKILKLLTCCLRRLLLFFILLCVRSLCFD